MKTKLQQLQKDLATGFVGRDEIVKSTLLGVVAGENTLLIGPPGTGKSMLARRVSEAIHSDDNADYFEYLLTKFSTPEEIFGPLSISELKKDNFCRNIDGYLPSVKIGFLDEIFKASSSILNALLTILNERKYHNGTHSVDVPLQSLISASNELPLGQEELSALYDRFLIRRFVGYVSSEQLSALFDLPKASEIGDSERLTVDELADIRERAKAVVFPSDVQQAIKNIWANCQSEFKENKDEQLSDRRFVKVLNLMRISAVTNERNAVDFSDILLLKDCLWNNPENQERIRTIIIAEIQKYDKEVDLVTYRGSGTKDSPFLIESFNHLKGLEDPKVGQSGYCFKQTVDIDCTNIDDGPWLNIKFYGHYDGNNHLIVANDERKAIFSDIDNSNIENVFIKGAILAEKLDNCWLSNCHSSVILFKIANKCSVQYCSSLSAAFSIEVRECEISNCWSQGHFAINVFSSQIEECHSRSSFIANTVQDSEIMNCMVKLENVNLILNNETKTGCFARELKNSSIKNSYVEGFFVKSDDEDSVCVAGIANDLYNSRIENCAVGTLEFDQGVQGSQRVAGKLHGSSSLLHNVSLWKNDWGYRKSTNDVGGLTLSSFDPAYFTQNLRWDFDNVWQWNKVHNHPELQDLTDWLDEVNDLFENWDEYWDSDNNDSVNKAIRQDDNAEFDVGKISLLKSQMQNNIWL